MNSQQIVSVKDSPRLNEEGIICWYEGDVFSIVWKVNLNDTLVVEDEEEQYFNPTDHLIFQFFGEGSSTRPVAKFDFTKIEDNTVELKFTQAISKKMTAGDYTFCIKRVIYDKNGEISQITTIGAKGNVRVEACH
jgi:hypothetical protein